MVVRCCEGLGHFVQGQDHLAFAGRTMSFNDLQSGAPQGEGQADDRNVELLVEDPR